MSFADTFNRWGEQVADRINPIVVKEVRQGLRTRVFWVFFSLMLTVCVFISLYAFGAKAGVDDSLGKGIFATYFTCLGLVQFFVIPYMAYRSMSREAEDETWVLLTLTGIGSRRVLSGKVGSAVLQGLLYSSAATPFMLFSYFLNGIDLPTILVAVAMATAYQVFLVSVAVSISTLATSRVLRALLHFVLLGILFVAFFLGTGLASSGVMVTRMSISSTDLWAGAAAILFGMLTTGILLFEAAAARLSLVTEDYARGPRVMYLVQVLGAALFFAYGWHVSGDDDFLVAGSVVLSTYTALVGLFLVSDRDGMAKVHWSTGNRYHLLKPGSLRGFLWVIGLLLVMTAVFAVCAATDETVHWGEMLTILAAPAFALMMLSLPLVIFWFLPTSQWQSSAVIRVLFVVLVVLMTGLPPLLGSIVSQSDDVVLNALNPILGISNIEERGREAWPLTLLVWGVGSGVAAAAYFSLKARDTQWLV